jgi:clan AA aspartic protease
MMRGIVNPDLEATLSMWVFGPGGRMQEVVCVIDTGFSGALALPLTIIAALALVPLAPRVVRLADGSQRILKTYEVEMLWDGSRRALRVLALDGESLIGTSLLCGYDLSAGFVDGGPVLVQRRP